MTIGPVRSLMLLLVGVLAFMLLLPALAVPDALDDLPPLDLPACACVMDGECRCGVHCQCGDECPCQNAPPVAAPPDTPPPVETVIDPVTGMAVAGPSIIQLGNPGCAPCILFWDGAPGIQSERSKYEAAGYWSMYKVDDVPAPVYPSYRIYHGDKWYSHAGQLTPAVLQSLVFGHPPVRSEPVPQPAEMSGPPQFDCGPGGCQPAGVLPATAPRGLFGGRFRR